MSEKEDLDDVTTEETTYANIYSILGESAPDALKSLYRKYDFLPKDKFIELLRENVPKLSINKEKPYLDIDLEFSTQLAISRLKAPSQMEVFASKSISKPQFEKRRSRKKFENTLKEFLPLTGHQRSSSINAGNLFRIKRVEARSKSSSETRKSYSSNKNELWSNFRDAWKHILNKEEVNITNATTPAPTTMTKPKVRFSLFYNIIKKDHEQKKMEEGSKKMKEGRAKGFWQVKHISHTGLLKSRIRNKIKKKKNDVDEEAFLLRGMKKPNAIDTEQLKGDKSKEAQDIWEDKLRKSKNYQMLASQLDQPHGMAENQIMLAINQEIRESLNMLGKLSFIRGYVESDRTPHINIGLDSKMKETEKLLATQSFNQHMNSYYNQQESNEHNDCKN